MDWFAKTLQIIGAILALLILIGGAWALVRGSFNQARVKEQREEIADLDRRDVRKTQEITELKASRDALENQVHSQQNQIDTLTAALTQRAEVEAVAVLITEHHEQAMEHWDRIADTMDAILLALGEHNG